MIKKCVKCENEYPLTNKYFYRSSDSKDGHRNECKKCHNLWRKKYLERIKTKKQWIVYYAKNKITGKLYIGATGRKLNERRNLHKTSMKKGKEGPFWNAMRKDGFDNFVWGVMKIFDSRDEAYAHEKFLIDKIGYNKLYNTHDGNEIKRLFQSKETRKKLSVKKLGKLNPMYGKKLSEEAIKALNKASCDICSKPVIRIADGVEYVSISECARQNNKSIATISLHVNNKLKKQLFKFKKELPI